MPTKTFFRLAGEKQEAIIRSAVTEFVKNGYSRAKIVDIAKGAGISKGSVFQYFADKRELFVYCAEWGVEMFMRKIDARMRIGGMDIFEYIGGNMDMKNFDLMQNEGEVTAFMDIIMREPGLFDDAMTRMYEVGDFYTRRLIRNGIRNGTVRDDIDEDLLMEFVYAVSDRFKRRWFKQFILDLSTELDPKRKRAMVKEFKQMLMMLRGGIGVEAGARRRGAPKTPASRPRRTAKPHQK